MKTSLKLIVVTVLFSVVSGLTTAEASNGKVGVLNSIHVNDEAKPFFRNQEGRLFINLLNLNKSDVKIKVMDSEGRLLFTQTVKDELLVEKTFNFKDAYKDSYRVVIEMGGKKFVEVVTVG